MKIGDAWVITAAVAAMAGLVLWVSPTMRVDQAATAPAALPRAAMASACIDALKYRTRDPDAAIFPWSWWPTDRVSVAKRSAELKLDRRYEAWIKYRGPDDMGIARKWVGSCGFDAIAPRPIVVDVGIYEDVPVGVTIQRLDDAIRAGRDN